jgi:tetratricopeptide (TPR) repeat protein
LAAIPVRYALDRSAWREAAALAPRTSPFAQAEAIIWFGKALGAARTGDIAAAKQALAEIASRQQQLAAAGDPYWADQVGIQETAASAWIALAGHRKSEAITLMRSAADREDRSEKSVAMENRLSPMRELLGELLLQAARPKDALAEFERSLEAVPNRRRSLNGAAEAAEKSGSRSLAQTYRQRWTDQRVTSLPPAP